MKTTLIVIALFISISTVLSDNMKGIVFPDVYYYQLGDSTIWADTSIDYQSWNSFGPKEFPYEKWEGIGWFRFEMLVDSVLCDIPLGMTVEQIGAVEIYIDGERVYQHGKVGRSIDDEEAYLTEWFPKPQPVIFKRKSADSLGFVNYQLAVRYSSFIIETPVSWGAKPRLNFEINDFSEIAIERAQIRKKAVGHQMLLFGILFTFGLIHLLFYIYYSKIKANLFFSAIALSAAFLSYLRFESYFITDSLIYVWSLRLFFTLGVFLTIATLQFTYSLLYPEQPKQMGFGRMYMAMIVAKLNGNSLNLSTAGMPDPLIWKNSTGELKEVGLQGLPLGTFSGFAYQSAKLELEKGDTVLLMSDGLPELPDPSGKQIGHDVVLNLFKDIAEKSTQEILDLLLKKAREWCTCDVPEDDLTLMVLKMK